MMVISCWSWFTTQGLLKKSAVHQVRTGKTKLYSYTTSCSRWSRWCASGQQNDCWLWLADVHRVWGYSSFCLAPQYVTIELSILIKLCLSVFQQVLRIWKINMTKESYFRWFYQNQSHRETSRGMNTDWDFVTDPISLCFICSTQHDHQHLPLYVSKRAWSALNIPWVQYFVTQLRFHAGFPTGCLEEPASDCFNGPRIFFLRWWGRCFIFGTILATEINFFLLLRLKESSRYLFNFSTILINISHWQQQESLRLIEILVVCSSRKSIKNGCSKRWNRTQVSMMRCHVV